MQTQRITNAQLVNEGSIQPSDLLIRNGRIESIASSLSGSANETVFDAQGKLLFPGMIDAHVHFREPGLENKGTLHSESRAALSGGITSIMEMPNTKPAAITNEILEDKFSLASKNCLTNFSFYLGASNTNLDQLLAVDPQNVCGVKLFLGSSTGNLVVDNEQQIEEIFKNVSVPIALHCEVDQIIRDNEQAAKETYGANVPFSEHGRIRSRKACWLSTQYAVELAKKHTTRIHILHMTTADELEFFTPDSPAEKHITVEACPHHLWFSEEDYETQGARVKCNPAIKTAEDRQALRDALKSGLIDTVGTDHAPHLASEKENTYFEAPSGMPCVQSALPSLLEYLTPEMAATKTAHNPATIYQCKDRGFIREGYHADLTIVDPDQPHTVSEQNILYQCGWSPFEGVTFQSTVHATFVNGNLLYHEGQILGNQPGMRLTFDR
ncbi:MAG: dihydroorotase [Kiritimatiellaceae bacterium TMED266]|nr:MAG: dihydroorotase [Kiritimatiellaceae bacterium TMED266]